MTEPNDFHLTSAEGSILVEITSRCGPPSADDLKRPRNRPPWMQRDKDGLPPIPPENEPPSDPAK